MDFRDSEIKGFKNILDYFRKFTTGGINLTEEKFLIQMLDRSLRFYFYLVYEEVFEQIERITINRRILGSNKRLKTISQLKYPPAHLVKRYGRCNLPKQSVFYGTFTWMTAHNEMRPELGDLITRTKWINKSKTPVKYCPIFLNQPDDDIINPRTLDYANDFYREVEKKFPEKAARLVIDLFQFVSDAFARRIETGNDRDYLFSAYFANKILYEFNDGQIDAIYYPSVKEKLSFDNIALKPHVFDNIYELVELHESVVTTVPNRIFKGYMMEGIAECKNFDIDTGKIIWEKSSPRYNATTFEETKRKYNLDLE